jgi:DNA primase
VRIVELPPGEDPDSLVRRDGKEQFEKRVANAPDFFDYWIEREAANVDLSSSGAKIQAAQRTAGLISRIGNDAMRNEVIYKAAARLDLPAADLKNLLPKLSSRPNESVERGIESVASPQKIKQLCILALRDLEVRNFLLAQPWRRILAKTPGTELLCRILSADVQPEDPATIASFLASLEPKEEAQVSNWISPKRIPYTDRGLAYQWWQSLTAEPLQRELEALKNKMRLPNLSAGEVLNLQKQILDLQEQLHDFWRPVGGGDT